MKIFFFLSVRFFFPCLPSTLEENVFLAYRPALCSIVFSALAESNGALQITATSVLTLLARQTGETAGRRCSRSKIGDLRPRSACHRCAVSPRSAAGLRHRAGRGSPDRTAADGGGRRSQVSACRTPDSPLETWIPFAAFTVNNPYRHVMSFKSQDTGKQNR